MYTSKLFAVTTLFCQMYGESFASLKFRYTTEVKCLCLWNINKTEKDHFKAMIRPHFAGEQYQGESCLPRYCIFRAKNA